MLLADTHVHLNFDVFDSDLLAVARRWREAGVSYLVHSCVEPGEFRQIQAIANQFPELFFAVGLHPLDVDQWQSGLQAEIKALAQSDPKVVAIGETGLDFYKSEQRELQPQAFWGQLEVAYQLGLPIIIHCRDAAVATAKLLKEFWQQYGPVSGVMHCWTGSPEETAWFLELGLHISFSGVVTFKSAAQVRDSALVVPVHRLLIETDCPFLAPVPYRGKRNEPAHVQHTLQAIASLRDVSAEALAAQTHQNACNLFKLPQATLPAVAAVV